MVKMETLLSGDSKPYELPKFIADHPFLYFIWDKKSNTLIFTGRITTFGDAKVQQSSFLTVWWKKLKQTLSF